IPLVNGLLGLAGNDLTPPAPAHPCHLPHGGASTIPKISRRNSATSQTHSTAPFRPNRIP
ncbi:hypothetical protein COCCADRAFT_95867, partial [Bipolaris zeicola 26-R-13]